MGERNTRSLEAEGTGKSGGQTNNGASSATTENRGTGGGNTGKESAQRVPKLVAVEVPVTTEEKKKETEKKKRGRPAGSTKKNSKSPKKSDAKQISLLLVTISGILASRPGMEPFALTMEEANQIAEPLNNIISKNEAIAGMAGEYADHITLLVACITIFIPKYLLWKSLQPKKEKGEKKANGKPNEKGQTAGSIQLASRKSRTSHDGQTFDGNLSKLLPPIAGI